MGKYLKTAFLYHWNLLAFLGAAGFGLVSGQPPAIWAPLLLAGEFTYLGLLASNPKFQSYVDARGQRSVLNQNTATAEQSFRKLLDALPDGARRQFQLLRVRCLELQRLAEQLKEPSVGSAPPLSEFRTAGLDRLLWIYLRLLYSHHALSQFVEASRGDQIRADIRALEQQLKQFNQGPLNPQKERAKTTVADNLQTCRDRLANFEKASDNLELLQLEVNRLENKIQSLSELAINRQEPQFISAQIDQTASSLVETERTMNELSFATGLSQADDAVPVILQRQVVVER